MAVDSPHASWHPALMPNSASDLDQLPRHQEQQEEEAPQPPAKPSVPEPTQPSPPEESTATSSLPDAKDPFDQGAADDAWFPEYEAGGELRPAEKEEEEEVAPTQTNEANSASEPEATQEPPVEEQPALEEQTSAEEQPFVEEQHPAVEQTSVEEQDPEAAGNTSKHLSTMSFARTVSHEFNWNDDEDAEFSLQKNEPDPFKFMPRNDRTNSFPVVPTLQSPHVEEIEHSLSANEAQDIVDEVERQEEKEEAEKAQAGLASAFDDTNDEDFLQSLQDGSDQQQYIGGDVQGTSEEASDARYAEGLPLVSHHADGEADGPTEDATRGQDALTTDFTADDDDFFAHVQDSTSSEPHEPGMAPLERKSTMQVLDDLGMGKAASDMATVEEEADEEAEDAAHADEVAPQQEAGVDLDAKWKEVFAEDDDEDFLLEDTSESKEVDPAAFFGDDDEGFLEDVANETAAQPAPAPESITSPVGAAPAQPIKARYLPTGQTATASIPANPYLPAASPFAAPSPAPFAAPAPASVPPMAPAYGAPPARREPNKAQSFVDKKGGYQSPYDLPMEVVKPRKRVSMQNLQRPANAPHTPPVGPPAPPRSTSMYAQAPPQRPTAASVASLSPPTSRDGPHPPAGAPKAIPPKAKEAFFEDLPVVSKPRPASRHSLKGMPSPSLASPYGATPASHPPPHVAPQPAAQYLPPQPVLSPPASTPEIPALVAPGRVSPYAPLQSSPSLVPNVPPPAQASRYSPAPPSAPHLNGVTPPAPPSRYSPAPPASRPQSAGYGAAPVGPAPPALPHQPRTSSPLAHFEVSHDRSRLSGHADNGHADRRGSSTYEQRLQRVPSLPPTREVEEEDGAGTLASGQAMMSPPPASHAQGHSQLPYRPRQTPPPAAFTPQMSLSPPKRVTSSYSPTPLNSVQNFAPPQRSQTQSPGALYGRGTGPKPVDPIPRPSSVHGPTSPRAAAQATFPPPGQTSPTATRQRGFSQNFNLIAPTDGREHDPLQRWKGVPVIAWGVGGTVVTSFPKDVPRYGMGQSAPMVIRSPGEVKVQTIKDLEPLEERLSKFPGPLKGKSKKKETLAWLTAGIETLEAGIPKNLAFQHHVSHEDKRAEERVLLWKILRLFVEHDGILEGNPTVEQAVREILSPDLALQGPSSPLLTTGANIGSLAASGAIKMHADAVDPSSIEELRNYLLTGDREKAVWAAADKRLWGHAMLIANTVSQDLYKKVTQEFVKKEVNSPGHNNESLAALYEVLSGNHEDCVDELVPVHARAGLQLLAKDSGVGATKDVTEGLDKWRETLSLILSNRSADDARAMGSLGNLLSSYGRAEAAHICFIFAKNQAVFGGLDDPSSSFVLVGSDHRRQVEQFAKEAEPLLLSEVYEYGLSLAGSSPPINTAHLAGYKYQHALTLAEYGFKDKALQYCDAILNAIAAQTRRSPYHHALLEAAVEDLSKRLKLAPKEGSNSWIPKPSMNKVSDSVWNRFNKFVAGDDNENSGQGSPTHGVESGPFARIGGGTPTISRPPSAAGLETFGATVPGYPMVSGPVAPQIAPAGPTRTASRYAPGAQSAPAVSSPYEPSAYAPRASMERTSSELNRSSFEMTRPAPETQHSYTNAYGYTPINSAPAQGLLPVNGTTGLGLSSLSRESSYMPVSQHQESPPSQQPPATSTLSGYQPHLNANSAPNGAYQPSPAPAGSDNLTPADGYQPPSYGYEPPSFTPQEAAPQQESQPESKAAEPQPETNGGGYEPPSYQPYGYEPPSYQPDSQPTQDESDEESKPKPKKRGPMYDDEDDDLVVSKTREKSKEEKDRENAEMFRKIAEEEAKRAEAAKSQPKKGWLGGWFGGKKDASPSPSPEPQQQASGTANKPIRAKLGEANSFYYDPEQKRWVNKNASAEDQVKKSTATPPPPRGPSGGGSASARSTPPPPAASASSSGDAGRASAPPGGPRVPSGSSVTSNPGGPGGETKLAPPAMMRSASNNSAASGGAGGGPPSRPTTSMSNASSIDDLLGAAGPRVKGAAKKKKGGRYVDVMAKP
ncbi:Sec23-binding domain of Sec16-domain-containing protein [Coniochaeta sp. 2T2.1]|nr:Sec23-binding domain of Sec16-domain-containing protein [Coniochaeta sp. 2T2.1]